MESVYKTLNILNYFGAFPLIRDEDGIFRFRQCREYFRFFVWISFFNMSVISGWISAAINGFGGVTFKKMSEVSGYSAMDMFSGNMAEFIGNGASILLLTAAFGNRVGKLQTAFDSFARLNDVDWNNIQRNALKKCGFLLVSVSVAAVFTGVFMNEFVRILSDAGLIFGDNKGHNVAHVLMSTLNAFSLFSPILFGSLFVALCLIQGLERHFANYAQESLLGGVFDLAFKSSPESGLTEPHLRMKIREIESLIRLKSILSEALTPFLLLITLFGFLTATLYGFISYTIIFTKWDALRIAATAHNVVVFKSVIAMLVVLFRAGQKLENRAEKVKVKLIRAATSDSIPYPMNARTHLKLTCVVKDLEKVTLSPAGILPLNYHGLLTVVGLILTYLIVLLQFKVAEFGVNRAV